MSALYSCALSDAVAMLDGGASDELLSAAVRAAVADVADISASTVVEFCEDDGPAPEGWIYFLELDAMRAVRDYWEQTSSRRMSTVELVEKLRFYARFDAFE